MSDQPLKLVHWPECTNDPCACCNAEAVIFKGYMRLDLKDCQLEIQPIDMSDATCLDCGWTGRGYQLKAQACPVCDGRCADC